MSARTTVDLLWIEGRIERWIRFGRIVQETIRSRSESTVGFDPGAVFAFVRWSSNDYGTVESRIDILRAVHAGERCSTVPHVTPGGEMLLRLSGWAEGRSRAPRHRPGRGARARAGGCLSRPLAACPRPADHWSWPPRLYRAAARGLAQAPRGDGMIRARKTLLVMSAALTLIGASAVVRSDPVVVWNASASVPVGFYAVTPITRPDIGDLVALRPPEPLGRWLVENGYLGPDTPLLKRVAAVPGSEVCRHGTTIIIDGDAVAEARDRDRLGRPLPVWRGCRTLRDGELFFLNADHTGSLDGRYFGSLDRGMVIGRATPIWTREG